MTFNHIFLLRDNSFCSIPSLHLYIFLFDVVSASLTRLLLHVECTGYVYILARCRFTYFIFFSFLWRNGRKKNGEKSLVTACSGALGKLDFIYRFFITVYSLFPISTKIFINRDNCPFFRLFWVLLLAAALFLIYSGADRSSERRKQKSELIGFCHGHL